MLPWLSRAISKLYTTSNFQRNTGIIRKCSHTFSYQNYSKVTAASEPDLPDSSEKTYTSGPEVNLNKMFWSNPCSLALPPDSPQRIEDPKYEGFKRVILKLMLFYSKQSQSIRWANAIYSRVLYQVDRPAIYDVFSLEKTFKTTFSLLVIHMWLCLRRLKEEGEEGVELGQYLYEMYNHDLELRVSKAGVNLLLTKWMKDLERIFYGNIVAYDASMLPEGKQDQLQSVIWRNVFSDDGSSKPSDAALPLVQARDDGLIYVNEGADNEAAASAGKFRKLLVFSGNDYLGLSSHPTVSKAAIKAAREHGVGPRGSALICGYTNYHRLLESSLADLKRKEDCLLCPTGLSANMAFITAVGNVGSLLAGGKPSRTERIAIFSDALNHASIIDGIRLAEKQGSVLAFVYKHCDTYHLDALLSKCPMKKRVVVTDSLFSMDGDFAPMTELVKLRKKHRFLLVIDDAHATFVCGKTGGGAAEKFKCETDVDICVGTLSKAAGCHGGFIACSKKWKLLIQSRGRSFIFSTSTPVPVVVAAHAAVSVAKEERWRRRAIWNRVRDFQALTGIPVTSPIISLVVGSEEKAIQASRHLLKLGFHITAIRPPTVPPNSCRLRITLSAVHTLDDLRKLTNALSHCVNFQEIEFLCTNLNSKL